MYFVLLKYHNLTSICHSWLPTGLAVKNPTLKKRTKNWDCQLSCVFPLHEVISTASYFGSQSFHHQLVQSSSAWLGRSTIHPQANCGRDIRNHILAGLAHAKQTKKKQGLRVLPHYWVPTSAQLNISTHQFGPLNSEASCHKLYWKFCTAHS